MREGTGSACRNITHQACCKLQLTLKQCTFPSIYTPLGNPNFSNTKKPPMAFLPIAIPTLILLLFISLPTATLSQDPNSSSPSIAQCAPSLLPLAPCAPFVQGAAQSPSQPCCSNLKQLYTQEPHCLCLLLNDTTFNSFPINNTLALQLPLLCSLQVNISPCSGTLITTLF
jgi:hypothetical protein